MSGGSPSATAPLDQVIWHDLECGAYREDLALWRGLASRHGSPVLEIGAGTGRVALDLAPRGYDVTALDRDPALLAALERRAGGLAIRTVAADARTFELGGRFALCLVPMQTVQLLGGPGGRRAMLERVVAHLLPGALFAAALTPDLPPYDFREGAAAPTPDVCERDGYLYFSQPTAIYAQPEGYVLERRRERVTALGERTVEHDRILLDRLDPLTLEREAAAVGLLPAGRTTIPATPDYAPSEVVMLGA
jgi:SAM-dependent methyltransferase